MRSPLPLLACLYVVQGLPYGFQASALSAYLRSEGVSLTAIGFAGALAAPWMLKVLWAPLVDRYGSARFGRRRSWIVPMQALLALACVVAAVLPPDRALGALLVTIFVMNLFAATMDVAVDGLAVDVLREGELGHGNAVQVVGFKVGMLIGGGLLLWASRWIGWQGHFVAMAALVVVALVLTLLSREPPPSEARAAHTSIAQVLATLRRAVARPGAVWLLVIVATYKTGESLIDPMLAPFLVDRGFAREDLGLWLGTYGMVASIAGSVTGGWLATRVEIARALRMAGVLRAVPLLVIVLLAGSSTIGAPAVIATTIAEHFFGGMLTTAMFTFMMSRVDREVGASHFTLLATVEVLGKSPLSLTSGWLAERVGYLGIFSVGLAISIAWAAMVELAAKRG